MLTLVIGTLALADAGVGDEIAAAASYRSMRQASGAPAIPAAAHARAAAGERVTGLEFVKKVSAGKGWGLMVMNASVEATWMAVNDEESYPGRFKGLAQTHVVSGVAHKTDRMLFQLMNIPIITDRWWIIRQHHNADLYRASGGKLWEKYWVDATDPANLGGAKVGRAVPVDWVYGSWLLIPLSDGRTYVEYYSWSDPGGMIPAGPASRFAKGAIYQMLGKVEGLAIEKEDADRAGYVRPDQTPL